MHNWPPKPRGEGEQTQLPTTRPLVHHNMSRWKYRRPIFTPDLEKVDRRPEPLTQNRSNNTHIKEYRTLTRGRSGNRRRKNELTLRRTRRRVKGIPRESDGQTREKKREKLRKKKKRKKGTLSLTNKIHFKGIVEASETN